MLVPTLECAELNVSAWRPAWWQRWAEVGLASEVSEGKTCSAGVLLLCTLEESEDDGRINSNAVLTDDISRPGEV